jgi:hypothetical protein
MFLVTLSLPEGDRASFTEGQRWQFHSGKCSSRLLSKDRSACRIRERLDFQTAWQAQMRDALGVLPQGDDIAEGFSLAIIAAQGELECDAYGRAPPGLRSG